MSADADEVARVARRRQAIAKRTLATRRAQERRFWIGVGCATLVHAMLFVGVNSSSSMRELGDLTGSQDGIAIEIVDAADLESRNSVAMPDSPPPATGSVQPQPQPKQPQQAQPEPQQKPAEAEAAPPPEPAPPPVPALKKTTAVEKAPDQPTPPEPPKKPTPKTPPTKSASAPPLELSLPDSTFSPTAYSPGFARPPGITKSGENDEFGRGVIRALRRTMPGSDRLGQVTIRLLLSETGNIVEVRLMRSGGDPIMDQNVVFAAKQASFPIPPAGTTVADRTFLVTYVYR
jgi:TonB family protein